MFDIVTCACCKKEYIANNFSIYKIKYKGKLYRACSYSCYTKLKALKESPEHEELEKIIFSSKEISNENNKNQTLNTTY